KLGMSVSQAMSVAQHLYEQGLITYMRTDSVNLSVQALAQCKEEITKLFGEEYHRWFNYKTKSKGAQEAHEAIRPSYIDRQSIEGSTAEKRLYDLIWKRTVASQMVCAELDRTTITIEIGGSELQFIAQGEVIRFDGFLKLYSESTDDDNATEGSEGVLPKLTAGDPLTAKQIAATERYTMPPARYNEASLVKRLEELGIGRPSTYAPTITTIINRGYVEKQSRDSHKRNYLQLTLSNGKLTSKSHTESVGKERNRLSPTDIGMLVNDYLETQFGPILDYNFTASVEKEFDRVAEGEITWDKMIGDFYSPFHRMVDEAIGTQTDRRSQVRELGIDPKTGRMVKARIGRYGPMVEIEAEEGGKAQFASLKKGQLIEAITLEEALELFALPRTVGALDGEELVVGIGRFGAYVRHGKNFASLQKGDDPYTVSYERCVELMKAKEATATAARTPLRTFEEDKDMLIKQGPYGAYIAYKGKNYRLPKGSKAEELTLEACLDIVRKSKKK
ncbi:MAG: DNA topoisomerase I, partial [Alistipes sp.]|nr:DNA topoisomerase I [Alistipes sp.]